jgi:hypothetical protein
VIDIQADIEVIDLARIINVYRICCSIGVVVWNLQRRRQIIAKQYFFRRDHWLRGGLLHDQWKEMKRIWG